MKLVMFSKMLKDLSVAQLIEKAHELKLEGYDLTVRPGYAVNPDNAGAVLKTAVADFESEGLSIPIVTGRGDLLNPDDDDVKPLLAAMDTANVRLLKMGYFKTYVNDDLNYWREVERIRGILEKWEALAKTYNVRVLYHTHSSDPEGREYFGVNAAALMHLIRGLDSHSIGAYLDAGHLAAEGERFPFAVSMTGQYLQAVALKDVREEWDAENSRPRHRWVGAGEGMVDWDLVFSELARMHFQGPVSIHCEYECDSHEAFLEQLPREIGFFKEKCDSVRTGSVTAAPAIA